MITEKIGLNAGRLWELLNEKGEQSMKEAKKTLKITNPDLFMAMGWLSREHKLSVSDNEEMTMTLK